MSRPDRRAGGDWRAALAELGVVGITGPPTLHAAGLLLACGRTADAEAAYRAFVDQYPDHVPALVALAALLRRTGRGPEAADVLGRAARAEAARFAGPDDRTAVAEFLLAAGQCAAPPAGSPPAYVADLFDRYADGFDGHLRDQLQYRAPELLLGAVSRLAGTGLRDADILDLGCGTGLAGEVFRPSAHRLDGVDLSPEMVKRAAAKGVYDGLATGELVAYLVATDRQFDLILAADVLVYLGDLGPVFSGARRVLRAGGLFAFTVEAGEGAGYHLQPTRRYAHHRDYVAGAAGAAGFDVRTLEETWTRQDGGRPVPSYLCVLSARAAPGATGPLTKRRRSATE